MVKVWGAVLTPTCLPCFPSALSTVPGLSHTGDVCPQEVWLRQCGDKVKVQRVKNPHGAISAATEDVVMIHRDAVGHSGLRRTEHTRRQISNVLSLQRSPDTQQEEQQIDRQRSHDQRSRSEMKSSPGSKDNLKINLSFLRSSLAKVYCRLQVVKEKARSSAIYCGGGQQSYLHIWCVCLTLNVAFCSSAAFSTTGRQAAAPHPVLAHQRTTYHKGMRKEKKTQIFFPSHWDLYKRQKMVQNGVWW